MKISVENIVQEAEALFTGEYNCAEAVSAAIIRAFRGELPDCFPNAATGFGGGIGSSHDDVCGALTGGIMAIGFVMGPTASRDRIKQACSELRSTFLSQFQTTRCGTLLSGYSNSNCTKVVGFSAEQTAFILLRAGSPEQTGATGS